MNDSDMAEFVRLWNEGVPVKQIARRLNYSAQYINAIARHNRNLTPSRHPAVSPKDRAPWVDGILSGRCTTARAARELGISWNTMHAYVLEVKR